MLNSKLHEGFFPIHFLLFQTCLFHNPLCLAPFSGLASTKPVSAGGPENSEERQQQLQSLRPAAGISFSFYGGDTEQPGAL